MALYSYGLNCIVSDASTGQVALYVRTWQEGDRPVRFQLHRKCGEHPIRHPHPKRTLCASIAARPGRCCWRREKANCPLYAAAQVRGGELLRTCEDACLHVNM